MQMRHWLPALVCNVVICVAANGAENWPQWRGPDGQGHAQTRGVPTTFSETENVTWKAVIPGKGHSSPVIYGDQIWVTTAIETPADEATKKERLKKNTGGQPLNILASVTLRAVCVNKNTGKIEHDLELMSVRDPQWVHTLNSYASPTPVIEAVSLYCHFGAFGTVAIDTAAGKIAWTNSEHIIMHENGPGSTPIVHGDKLIFHCDGSDKQYIAALDKNTGKSAWQTPRTGKMNANVQLKKAYGTPLVVEIAGKAQLVSPAADWLYVYDPQTGKELWKLSYDVLGFSTVPRPVTGHGLIYMCTSFMKSELLAIDPGNGEAGAAKIAWRYKQGVPQMPSPLLVGDELFIISDQGGVVTCLDAKTGEPHFRERIDGNYSASPTLIDGRIYFLSREGVCTVLAPGKAFKVLAKNKLDGGFMASPAAVDGALFLRTDSALYRIEAKKQAAR